jgi:predicted MFS family arabinose efflux permease
MFGVLLFITYFLQVTLGYLPLRAGLAFLPFSGGIVLGSLAVSALLPRTGPQPPMVLGMLLATLGMLWLTRVSGTSTWLSLVLPAEMLLGVGLGFVFVPLNSTALSGIEPNDAGVASALLNTTQQVGGALGVALLNALYTARTATHLLESPGDAAGAALTAYRLVFAVGSGLFSVATLLTIFWLVSPKRQSSLV